MGDLVPILIFSIPLLGITAGMLSSYFKHKERMAKGTNDEAMLLLTETLERQSAQLKALSQRVDALEGPRIPMPDTQTQEEAPASARSMGRTAG